MLRDTLQKYGLSEKEADVYLALLELGTAKSSEISLKTKLPRSTVYSELEYLEEKGLVFSYDQGKIKTYAAQDPMKIVSDIVNQAQTIKSIFPELKNLYQKALIKPQIMFYKGLPEIKEMHSNILKIKGLKTYDLIGSEKDWIGMDKKFFEDFKKKRAGAGIKTRLIVERSETALARKQEAQATLAEVKILPPSLDAWQFSAGTYIFEDKVIFTAFKKEHIAFEIISIEIASLMKMMFQFMWQFLAK